MAAVGVMTDSQGGAFVRLADTTTRRASASMSTAGRGAEIGRNTGADEGSRQVAMTALAPAPANAPARSRFADRPALVFWETTRACLLACHHCRASAQPTALPGELDTMEGMALLQGIARFGPPLPVVVFTGGDVLMRRDLFELLQQARRLGLVTAVSPSVTDRLDDRAMTRFKAAGVHGLSISIDGNAARHDRLRGVPGTFDRSVRALREALGQGLRAQVNTVVMRSTVNGLADMAALLLASGVRTWEVFFLVATGRALASEYLTPNETVDVLEFLLDATGYGIELRVVEGPFIRRALRARETHGSAATGELYARLATRLKALAGEPTEPVRMARSGTLDGDGILFVAHDGAVYPGGLLPLELGQVRRDDLVRIYRRHPVLLAIRGREFVGVCGTCEARAICGGSRARAYGATHNPLGSDPLCPWQARA